jgi:enhancer of mRNA-decapping protein 4
MQLTHAHGEGPHLFNNVKDDFLKIDTHSSAVTDASFSPDGTALATCSKDGTVKFFQVSITITFFLSPSCYLTSFFKCTQIYFQERAPARCLYSWAPHDGRPIDRIFFLDNHMLDHGEDNSQYWKYLVTAADGCSEFKLFSCRSWKCMQTLRFYTPGSLPSQWKVEVSTSGRYIMTTNIHNKAMYLLHVECSDTAAQFGWIREFSMPWNIIGFNISSAGKIRYSDVISKGYGPAGINQ